MTGVRSLLDVASMNPLTGAGVLSWAALGFTLPRQHLSTIARTRSSEHRWVPITAPTMSATVNNLPPLSSWWPFSVHSSDVELELPVDSLDGFCGRTGKPMPSSDGFSLGC